MKRCKKCGIIKPLDDSYMSAGMRDGHRNDCRVCNLREKQERYRADPEAAKARVKRWQQANAERVNEYWRRRRTSPRSSALGGPDISNGSTGSLSRNTTRCWRHRMEA